MITPSNRDIQKLQRELANSTFKRGVITAINLSAWTADVYIVGNEQSVIRGIPMSSAISATTPVGARCRVDMFDPTNPKDMVIAYVYGIKPT